MNWTIVAPLLGIVVSALVTYLVAARRMSGKIATSDASDLWVESKSIREDYRGRLLQEGERTARLEARVAQLESTNHGLLDKNMKLQAKVDAQEGVIESLKGTITTLETTIKEMEGATS